MTQANAPVIADFDIQNLQASNQNFSIHSFDLALRNARPQTNPIERREATNVLMAAVNETDQRRMPQKIEAAFNSLMTIGMTRIAAANFLNNNVLLETEDRRYLDDLIRRGQMAEAREFADRHRKGEFDSLNDLGRYIQQHDPSYYQRFQENIKQFGDMVKALNGRMVPTPLRGETALAAKTQERINQLVQQAAAMDKLKEDKDKERQRLAKDEERRRQNQRGENA